MAKNMKKKKRKKQHLTFRIQNKNYETFVLMEKYQRIKQKKNR